MPLLYRVLAKVLNQANKAEKFTVDLATARSDTSLAKGGVFLKLLKKGTGTFSFKFEFEDGSTAELTQDEVSDGDAWRLGFEDILFTNTSQSVENPVFWLESAT